MMTPRMAGFIRYHSRASSLVTETKSVPKNTPITPSTANRRSASGERAAEAASGKLAVPAGRTSRPGRNFSVAGLGVCSVWINMGQRLLGRSEEHTSELQSLMRISYDAFGLKKKHIK